MPVAPTEGSKYELKKQTEGEYRNSQGVKKYNETNGTA